MTSLRNTLVKWDAPILKKVAEVVTFSEGRVDPAIEQFIRDSMMKDWASEQLYAISAPLLGQSTRVVLVIAETPILMLNPKVVSESDDKFGAEEFAPNITVATIKVERPTWIRVRYTNINGAPLTQRFEGVTCRLVHQQLEYLDGVTPLDHAKFIRRNSIIKALHRLTKTQKRLNNV